MIYPEEKSIAELIENNKSIAYIAEIQHDNKIKELVDYFQNKELTMTMSLAGTDKKTSTSTTTFGKLLKTDQIEKIVKASIKDKELYYHTSILVTSTWNRNDDVFTPEVIWGARNTPVHKPTNLGHNSTKIIGHMAGAWAIDDKGEIIEENDEGLVELPSKFHILVSSVIYTYWPENEDYRKDIEELLEKIEAGEKYVSMECRFKTFDYALANDKELKIVARNENTAFLSKYLRAYGGDGTYKDYKIGRVVKDISFVGKGYVDKPANPESIVFSKDDIQDFARANFDGKIDVYKNNGVVSNNSNKLTENKIMSEFYQEENKKLESKLAKANESLEALKEQLAKSNVVKLEKEIETLKAQVADQDKALKAEQTEVTNRDKSVAELTKKIEDLTKSNEGLVKVNEELTKSNTEYKEQVEKVEAEKKIQDRVSTLVSAGLSKEDAEKEVKAFAGLNDETFKAVSAHIIGAYVKPEDKDKDKKKEKKVDAETVDTAEIKDEEVVSASVKDEADDVLKSLQAKLVAHLKSDENGDK